MTTQAQTERHNHFGDLDQQIQSLEYTYRLWEEEYKVYGPNGIEPNQSNMRKADLLFLDKQINRLKALRAKLQETMGAVAIAVHNHQENF